MEEIGFADVVSVFLRRKKLFFAVAGTLFLLTLFFALRWSNYRSEATVEVALPEVATDAVQTNASEARESLADLRISYLQQKVLSTGSLVEIITKYNLYPDARARRPVAEIAEGMRKKIKLSLVGTTLASPSAASRVSAKQLSAIAFTLSFDYSSPLLAQQATNELVSRFLDEDIKQRHSQAQETTAFLAAQIKTLEASLAAQEEKIAQWQTKYGETRPEALAFNQQAATSLMLSLQNIEGQLTTSLGTQGALRAQLASLDPYAGAQADGLALTTPTVQLRAARTSYATLASKYGPEHPDVVKARREMNGLERQLGSRTGKRGALEALLIDARARLDALKGAKGEENPDVVSLTAQIKRLEQQKRETLDEDGVAIIDDADNPAYLAVVAQLRAAKEQGLSLEQQKKSIAEQVARYQKAVMQNPEVERQMAELTRDYANAQERYRQMQAQKLAADMNETIEKDRVGQRLVIINPPELPLGTHPSRKVFLLAGFFAALLCGAAAVGAQQLLSQSVVGPAHLASLAGAPPLVIVAHLVADKERDAAAQKHARIACALFVLALIALGIASYAVVPLDVLLASAAQTARMD